MMRYLVAGFALVVLSGCEQPMAPDRLAGMTDYELCQKYSSYRVSGADHLTQQFLDELVRRKAVSTSELAQIKGLKISVGMREVVAMCSWGPVEATNETGGYGATTKQLVMYGNDYVYTENGRVRSWQQSY